MQDLLLQYTLSPNVEVAFVFPYHYREEEQSGWLTSEYTSVLADYVSTGNCNRLVTSLYPDTSYFDLKGKDLKNYQQEYRDGMLQYLASLNTRIIVCIGSDVLKSLWPVDRYGKAPSIAKARLTPANLGGGKWLLCTYHPKQHYDYFASGGGRGKDLNDEYTRLFTVIGRILTGDWTPEKPAYTVVQTEGQLHELARRIKQFDVVDIDIEDDAYHTSASSKKFHELPDYVPDRQTVWHPDTRLLDIGITLGRKTSSGYEYECYLLHESVLVTNTDQDKQRLCSLLTYLFSNTTIDAWNVLYELSGFYALVGWDWRKHYVRPADQMVFLGTLDHSTPGHGLKDNAQMKLGVPDWTLEYKLEKDVVMAQRKKDKDQTPFSFRDVSTETRQQYNTYDHWTLSRIRLEEFAKEQPRFAYEFLMDALPWVCEMMFNGLCVDLDYLYAELDSLELKLQQLKAEIANNPFVRLANAISGKDFNPRSKPYFTALVQATHNGQIPDDFPLTPSGLLKSGKKEMAKMAGTDPETVKTENWVELVPYEQKSSEQQLWWQVNNYLVFSEYVTKFYSYLNATVEEDDGAFIHPNFRIIKTDRPVAQKREEAAIFARRTRGQAGEGGRVDILGQGGFVEDEVVMPQPAPFGGVGRFDRADRQLRCHRVLRVGRR